ncbi:hypothetical protein GCM10010960_04430 [Arenimonas maotaiensis]|uniref:Prepilin-type N-terminal cleavage/methylation domain-containing protein n=1 Tax=Arenimonas maotaiensis TaxID=1446479 RepID=A0A917CF47_9GAMM|nr:prepilin-type N-terminal cleavage/methylation domain-containing protein [Arenimonas maotaiensis]GGF85532.1 hypothetical protein GCM10010960_04430 [Arenimonas maotaiensis]
MNRKHSRGLSLVELMIALAIGLIVVGAVLAFTLSSLTANSEYVQSTRLSQELRNSMDFVSRELRRAGYDQSQAGFIAASPINNPVVSRFSYIYIENNAADDGDSADDEGCVIYAYDRAGGTFGSIDLANGEIRAIRRVVREVDGVDVGVLEVAESASGITPTCGGAAPDYTSYPASCSSAGWCPLSDPRLVNITGFTLDTSGYIVQAKTATSTAVTMREIGIDLQGQLRQSTDGTFTRGIRSTVKVRADCLEASDVCDDAPAGT